MIEHIEDVARLVRDFEKLRPGQAGQPGFLPPFPVVGGHAGRIGHLKNERIVYPIAVAHLLATVGGREGGRCFLG